MRYFEKIGKVTHPREILYEFDDIRTRSDFDIISTTPSASKFLNTFDNYRTKTVDKIKKDLRKYPDDVIENAPLLVALRIRKEPLPKEYAHITDRRLNKYMKSLIPISKKEYKYGIAESLYPFGAMAGTMGLGMFLAKKAKDTDKDQIQLLHSKLIDAKRIHPETSLTFTSNALNSYYNPSTNAVVTGKDLAIAAHEFGHAENQKKTIDILGKKPGKVFSTIKYMETGQLPAIGPVLERVAPVLSKIPILGLAALPLVTKPVTNVIKGDNPESYRYRTGKFMYEHPETVVGAAVIPKLWEEGSASIKAVKNISRYIEPGSFMTHFKKLGPAFGTYALGASIPVVTAAIVGKLRRDREKKLKI